MAAGAEPALNHNFSKSMKKCFTFYGREGILTPLYCISGDTNVNEYT